MEIRLKPEQAEFVQTQVIRGRYVDADEVVSRALKLLQDWEKEYAQWLTETRQKVEVGMTQVQQGDVLEVDSVTDRLRAKILKAQDMEA